MLISIYLIIPNVVPYIFIESIYTICFFHIPRQCILYKWSIIQLVIITVLPPINTVVLIRGIWNTRMLNDTQPSPTEFYPQSRVVKIY